jgi:hypothetical protein
VVAVKSRPVTVPTKLLAPKNDSKRVLLIVSELPERTMEVGTLEKAVPASSIDRSFTRQLSGPVTETNRKLNIHDSVSEAGGGEGEVGEAGARGVLESEEQAARVSVAARVQVESFIDATSEAAASTAAGTHIRRFKPGDASSSPTELYHLQKFARQALQANADSGRERSGTLY